MRFNEVNPEGITGVDIVIGIPSFNEASSISYPAQQADKGLQKYFSKYSSVIINCDNDSPDNTKEAFLNTKTTKPKIYISTGPGITGKGNNLRNLFEKAFGCWFKNFKHHFIFELELFQSSNDFFRVMITGLVQITYDKNWSGGKSADLFNILDDQFGITKRRLGPFTIIFHAIFRSATDNAIMNTSPTGHHRCNGITPPVMNGGHTL